MTADELYNAIALIERRKWREKRTPSHVMRIAELQPELAKFGISPKEIDTTLRELLNDERIEAGQTINDTYVKTK